jgi:hypothetical protein
MPSLQIIMIKLFRKFVLGDGFEYKYFERLSLIVSRNDVMFGFSRFKMFQSLETNE